MGKPISLSHRLRRLRAALLAVSLTLAGVLLIMLGSWLPSVALGEWGWLAALPLGELGGVLFGAGVLGTLFEYSLRKGQEEATLRQLGRVIQEQAPALRDAVIQGFRFDTADLRRVATPELLDAVAENSLGLRFGDATFGREVYRQIRDQAVRAAERWRDVRIVLRVSGIPERSTEGTPLFNVTVQWEYTVVPAHTVHHFACVSDREEFHDLISQGPATSAWFMAPRPGMAAHRRESFELLRYSVDGRPCPIRRSQRATGQSYRVRLDEAVVMAGRPVRVSYVYRTVTPVSGHMLFLSIDQPAKGISVQVDYGDTDITDLRVLDLLPAADQARLEQLPASVPGRSLSVAYDGWVFPRAGFAFVWTLAGEADGSDAPAEPVQRHHPEQMEQVEQLGPAASEGRGSRH